MAKHDLKAFRQPWTKPSVRRIGGRSARFAGEVSEDGSGLS
jgi:hypothetical protein